MREEAIELLKIFELDTLKDEKAKNLAYGQQRELEIVRALATKPKVLFLDEPAAGMNPQETAQLTELIAKIQTEFDLTVVLIETRYVTCHENLPTHLRVGIWKTSCRRNSRTN